MSVLGRLASGLADSLFRRQARSGTMAFLVGLRKDVRRAFRDAVDPVTGQPWPPRRNPRTGSRPLVRTGKLMAAALAVVDDARPFGSGVTIDLTVPRYAVIHQFGAGRVPRRRFLGASPETVEAGGDNADGLVKVLVNGRGR